MATFEKRTGIDDQPVYRVKVRRKGSPQLSATFTKLSDAPIPSPNSEKGQKQGFRQILTH